MTIDYEEWHKKIDATLQWRQKFWNGDKAWKRFLALYRGDHWRTSRYNEGFLSPDSDVPRDRITVNVTGSTVSLAKSFLLKSSPKYVIKPRPELHSKDAQAAIVSALLKQELLNYEYEQQDMHRHIKDAVLDALIIGHGIVKNGFTDKRPIARSPKESGSIEPKEYIQDGTPYVERVNPFRFLFDIENESFRQLDNVSWVAEIFFRNKADVLADTSYNNKILKQIKTMEVSPETYKSSLTSASEYIYNKGDLINDLCALYEVWDKKHLKRYIFLQGIDEPLLEKDWPYDYLDGFPFEKIDFIPVPNEHYGLGIPAWIEDQQLELNRVRTTMYDHRRRFNRKYIALEGAIEPSEVNKLITGDTGTLVFAKTLSAIQPLQEGKIPSDAFAVENTIKADIMELTGVDQLARGGQLTSRTSAAEIHARQSYVNLKLDDRVADVDAFIIRTGRKVLQHIQSNVTTARVVKVAGSIGQFWVKFTPADIKGEFDIVMDTVSAPKIDEVADRQQALQIFQLIMQNIQFILQMKVPINFVGLFKWLFTKFGENDIGQFFDLLPNPQQGGGVPLENNQGNNNQTNTMNPPSVVNADQLRQALSGNLSGGGFSNTIPAPGVQ